MIQIARTELAHEDPSGAAPGLEPAAEFDEGRRQPSEIILAIERFVARRPGFCLGAAMALGIALGWWVKRR